MSNPNFKHEDPKDSLILSLEKRLLETTSELHKAHKIIFNALQLMSIEQKTAWAKANYQSGVEGEGATRANERERVLKRLAEVVL